MNQLKLLACLTLGPMILAACDRGERQGAAAPERVTAQAGAQPGSAAAGPGTHPEQERESFDLSCRYPVDGNRDNAASVLARFAANARREALPGPEGTELAGIVLWPERPERRLELVLDETDQQRVTGIMIRSKSARWRYRGLGPDAPLAAVAAANGKPFKFWGFGWDYGGYVSDWDGGKLENLPGGCTFTLRLETGPNVTELPDGAVGDRAVVSDDLAAIAARPLVSELALNWP